MFSQFYNSACDDDHYIRIPVRPVLYSMCSFLTSHSLAYVHFLLFPSAVNAEPQTIVMKGTLSASIVFSSMSIFDMLREQLHLIFGTVTEVIAGKVSLDRMNAFLHDVGPSLSLHHMTLKTRTID